jgi:predicted alpha/beta hydrolase family esterase
VNYNGAVTIERIVIVPRWAGSPSSDWYPWIRSELARSHPALRVDVLELPNRNAPVIEQCVAMLEAELGTDLAALQSTLLVGHSVGCQASMRYLAEQPESAEPDATPELVCVAGWWTIDEPWPSIRPWIDTPIALPRVRANTARVTVLLSDDDPFTRDWRSNESTWVQRLDADVRVSVGGRHFNGEQEPAVLDLLLQRL